MRSLPALRFGGSKWLSITVVAELVRVKATLDQSEHACSCPGMPDDSCGPVGGSEERLVQRAGEPAIWGRGGREGGRGGAEI